VILEPAGGQDAVSHVFAVDQAAQGAGSFEGPGPLGGDFRAKATDEFFVGFEDAGTGLQLLLGLAQDDPGGTAGVAEFLLPDAGESTTVAMWDSSS